MISRTFLKLVFSLFQNLITFIALIYSTFLIIITRLINFLNIYIFFTLSFAIIIIACCITIY